MTNIVFYTYNHCLMNAVLAVVFNAACVWLQPVLTSDWRSLRDTLQSTAHIINI